jgi:hypothetical protein
MCQPNVSEGAEPSRIVSLLTLMLILPVETAGLGLMPALGLVAHGAVDADIQALRLLKQHMLTWKDTRG